MQDNYDDHRDLADRVRDKGSDPSKSEFSDLDGPANSFGAFVVPFIIGAVAGFFICSFIWTAANFAEEYGNFSNLAASVAGAVISGIFGVIVKLIKDK